MDLGKQGEGRTGGMSSQDSEQHCWGRGSGSAGWRKRKGWKLLVEGPVPYFRNCVLIRKQEEGAQADWHRSLTLR